ncbi:MAG: D-alanyl-D-alanine carboxypeptidase/D-alanyl-D-alanine-endopeptidase [Gordonia sp. (in: high G+C Gram-positive bacteria)]|uniref:D-alanyl-D-alanine carboxypeptidase/D-alanyl-D-alanine endopeptidase n=1 Tax=Gordonia sp. (in: high G+C Gram-positive bacteria) TaxID=84139 RepID=UPI0039E436AA
MTNQPGAPTPTKKRTRRVLLVALSVLLVAGLATGGWFWWSTRPAKVPDGTPPQPAAVTVAPKFKPVSNTAPVPTDDGIAAQLAEGLKDPALGKLTGVVSDPVSGKTLWTQDPDTPRTPASNAKILTASAVLEQMPHDARLTTKVVAGDDPGEVILVGGGDPTLSGQPKGTPTFYTDAPRIADLADQLKKAGVQVSSVKIAPSQVDGPDMAKAWSSDDIEGGDIAPIQSLTIDGARAKDPLDEFSPRTPTPAEDAGRALADALDVHSPVEEAKVPAGAKTLASVRSAMLETRVGDMMRYSDNVLAESLGIELSTSMGGPASIEGGADAVVKVLSQKGFNTSGVILNDSSGLSDTDKVPATLLDQLVSASVDGKHPELTPMLDTFPVAGGTGTLADRFDKDNPGAGWVRAKTGTLTGVSSLTGIVQDVDGRVLSFALMSGGTSPADARPAIDALAGALRECGCRG